MKLADRIRALMTRPPKPQARAYTLAGAFDPDQELAEILRAAQVSETFTLTAKGLPLVILPASLIAQALADRAELMSAATVAVHRFDTMNAKGPANFLRRVIRSCYMHRAGVTP